MAPRACNNDCRRISELLSRLGDKWSTVIIFRLGNGKVRFNELKRELGISQRMLSLTLRDLERDGLVLRTYHPTIPPKVEYELTPLGRSLRGPVGSVADWLVEHGAQVDAARAAFDVTAES
jgi:DNA-binding HxlR family transcriptional regulator